jgi:hypothetical protein
VGPLNFRLSHRELETVLAALRYWRQDLADNEDGPIAPDHFRAGVTPLTVEEIDALRAQLAPRTPGRFP